ncbi:hypothetical protein acdb102_37170 [Acidothermaceae bacterium B102]|nr:hypothetical protein acdb102_37170 [Acidothermaceae bacterium B102]
MTDVRCPKCTAHVAAAAQWCGQCYTSLATESVKPARAPLTSAMALAVIGGESAPGVVALLGDVPPPPPPPGVIPPPPPPPGKSALRVGKQPWPCVRCETVNAYEDNTCTACGQGFLSGLAEPPPSLPLIGSIDATSRSGKIKIGVGFAVVFCVVLVVIFTVGGLLL